MVYHEPVIYAVIDEKSGMIISVTGIERPFILL